MNFLHKLVFYSTSPQQIKIYVSVEYGHATLFIFKQYYSLLNIHDYIETTLYR